MAIKKAKKAIKKTRGKSAQAPAKKAAKKITKKTKKTAAKKMVSSASVRKSSATKAQAKKIKAALKKQSPKKTKTAAKKTSIVKKKVMTSSLPATFVAHATHLKAGDKAPAFEGIDQKGTTIRLSDYSGKKVILYFYPKDDTPGCTAEACSLRDEYTFLGKNNYVVLGVSADDSTSHAKFAAKYELPFPLLADTEKSIIKAYDVWGTKQLFGKIYDGIVRTTFIIDETGIISEVIHSVDTENHAQQVLSL